MPKTMIFKLQRPLGGSTGDEMLAYNERRTVNLFLPPSAAILALFDGKPKIYVRGEVRGKILHVEEVLPDQSW